MLRVVVEVFLYGLNWNFGRFHRSKRILARDTANEP